MGHLPTLPLPPPMLSLNMETSLTSSWDLLKATVRHWMADNAQRLAAALAYYAVLALPPTLVILLFIVSLFYDPHSASSQVSQELNSLLGQKGGQFMQTLMANPQTHGKGTMATAIALVTLILTATGFFLELQSDLNSVWGVEQKSNIGWYWLILNRLFSFLMLLGIGVLLLLSILASAVLAAVHKSVGNAFPASEIIWRLIEFGLSFAILTALFAIVFKLLPDVRLRWRDVWVGAAITALLFTIGKLLLGLYLGHSNIASAYGVAGSIVLILVWIYYSALIFFFGAEFTQVYANRFGARMLPAKHAQWKAEGEAAAEDRGEMEASKQPRHAGVSQPESTPAPTAENGSPAFTELANQIHSWRSINLFHQ